MSGIPSNMNALGSIMQSQISSNEKAKTDQARENQEAQDARRIARLSEQQTDEVEETEATDDVFVRREDQRKRDGSDARDTWERHKSDNLYHNQEQEPEPEQNQKTDELNITDSDDQDGGKIIDLSV